MVQQTVRDEEHTAHDRRTFFMHHSSRRSTRLLLTSMLGKLWVGQDLFAELEPVSVLLVFVTSLSKKGKPH